MTENTQETLASQAVSTGSTGRSNRPGRIAFYGMALLASAFFLFGFWDIIPGVVLAWLPDDVLISIHPDFAELFVPHRIHQTTMHAVLWGLVLGVVLQLYHPERRLAPLLQSLSVFLAFDILGRAIGEHAGGFPIPLLFLLAILLLHPRRRELFRLPQVDRTMAGLAVLAAVPWLAFAFGQMEVSRLNLPADVHDQLEHWNRMAVFAILMVVWSLLGSSDLPGWRITAWIVAYGALVYGVQSLVFSEQASAAPVVWAIASAVWGLVYLAAAERRVRIALPAAGPG